jgi:NADPH:quinone reductase-like Zn-dependent oxidoreductase
VKALWFDSYGSAANLRCGDFADPVPRPSDVLVRVAAASVNPIDWKLREGALKALVQPEFPRIPGRDCCGRVVAVGEKAVGLTQGDLVWGLTDLRRNGTHATLHAVDHRLVGRVPAGLTDVEAGSLPASGVSALVTLFHTATVGPGQRVLIHAASGGVGSLAVQMAKARGAWVAATCGAANRDYVLSLGADQVIDHAREDFGVLRDLDAVIDTIGGEVHRRSFAVLRQGGIIAWLSALPLIADPARPDVQVRQAMVLGTRDRLEELAAFVTAGELKPQVGKVFPLADGRAAHELVQAGHVRGKVVLSMAGAG